jgi:hypothetical protein
VQNTCRMRTRLRSLVHTRATGYCSAKQQVSMLKPLVNIRIASDLGYWFKPSIAHQSDVAGIEAHHVVSASDTRVQAHS